MNNQKNIENVLYTEQIQKNMYLSFQEIKLNNEHYLSYKITKKTRFSEKIIDQSSGPLMYMDQLLTFDSTSIVMADENRLGLIYGVVSTPKGQEVKEIIVNNKIEAKLKMKAGTKFWFAFVNPKELNIPGLHIEALDSNNRTIYVYPIDK